MKTLPRLFLLLAFLSAGCARRPAATGATAPLQPTPRPEAVTLSVFAAASLTAAFGEIGELFEAARPGVSVAFNFAGSQQLAQQINEGAPADVFASANQEQMEVVIKTGGVAQGTQKTFVQNRLVVIFPRDNPAGLDGLEDLAKPGLKLVLAAKEVPAGKYTLDFLEKAAQAFGAAYPEVVLGNVVSYEDNVKVVLAKVALGEADAGIVYRSDVTEAEAGKVSALDIPDEMNVVAAYPIAPVEGCKHPELAQAFIDLVLASEGQEILAKYGFNPVQ